MIAMQSSSSSFYVDGERIVGHNFGQAGASCVEPRPLPASSNRARRKSPVCRCAPPETAPMLRSTMATHRFQYRLHHLCLVSQWSLIRSLEFAIGSSQASCVESAQKLYRGASIFPKSRCLEATKQLGKRKNLAEAHFREDQTWMYLLYNF